MSLVALSQDALGLADELTPLLLLRTLGLLARQHGVAMPTPFDVNYVPNFLTSCDRLSIERYADIVTRSVLDDFDVVKLESLLKEWYAATHSLTAGGKRKRTQQPALFRSRFTNCKSIDQFCSLIGAFHAATVPDAGPRIVHLWLTAKFGGVSKFTATVLLRELALYVDRLLRH